MNRFFKGLMDIVGATIFSIIGIGTVVVAGVSMPLDTFSDIMLLIVIIIFGVLLPLGWLIFSLSSKLIISEQGITQTLFGRKIRFIDWHEINGISIKTWWARTYFVFHSTKCKIKFEILRKKAWHSIKNQSTNAMVKFWILEEVHKRPYRFGRLEWWLDD